MGAEENELMARLVQNSIDAGNQVTQSQENIKTMFRQLVRMEEDRNHWKARALRAESDYLQLMMNQNKPPIDTK